MHSNQGTSPDQIHPPNQVEYKLVAGSHGDDGLLIKFKVPGVFGGVSNPLASVLVRLIKSSEGIATPSSIPTRNEALKSLPCPKIALVLCVFAISSACFRATADAVIVSSGCVRAACTVVDAMSSKLSWIKGLGSGMIVDAVLCD